MTIIHQYKLIREEPSSFLLAEVAVDGSGFGLLGYPSVALAANRIDLFSRGLFDHSSFCQLFGARGDGAR